MLPHTHQAWLPSALTELDMNMGIHTECGHLLSLTFSLILHWCWCFLTLLDPRVWQCPTTPKQETKYSANPTTKEKLLKRWPCLGHLTALPCRASNQSEETCFQNTRIRKRNKQGSQPSYWGLEIELPFFTCRQDSWKSLGDLAGLEIAHNTSNLPNLLLTEACLLCGRPLAARLVGDLEPTVKFI